MKLASLNDLYLDELRDLYSAETMLVRALPKMAKAASTDELSAAFREHLAETEGHVERLESLFRALNVAPGGQTCEAMEGLVKEAQEVIDAPGRDEVRDAALIAHAQRVEHYEIAGYGAVRTYAALLGRPKDAAVLQETLDEEGSADKNLTRIAEGLVNERALAAGSDTRT